MKHSWWSYLLMGAGSLTLLAGCRDADRIVAPEGAHLPSLSTSSVTVGNITDLGVMEGYTSSVGRAINDLGQVVGYGTGPSVPGGGWFWENGRFTNLDPSGSLGRVEALGINASGAVAGTINR